MAEPLAEKVAQASIVELATLLGWLVYHTHDSRRSQAGFPDLVLVRERVIFAEIKRVGEQPRPSQVEWLNGLSRAGAEVYVWTWDDYDEIARILSLRVPPPEATT